MEGSRFIRRPGRLDWVRQDVAPVFFVTAVTARRAPVLACGEMHDAFRQFGERADRDFGIAVGRYVLMPDHLHLFVHLPQRGSTLSAWVKSLKSVLGKRLLGLGVPKPHWQEGFFDHLLRSEESYAEKWEYVRANPVRAGLCAAPEDWKYQGEVVVIRY